MSLQLQEDGLSAAAAFAGGLLTSKLFDLGSAWPEKLISFAVGAVPAGLTAHLALADPEVGSTNLELVRNSLSVAWNAPATFGIIVIGMTTVVSLCYQMFLAPEFGALSAFLPFVSLKGIDVAVVWLGILGSVAFAGIAGWTIEVLEWVLTGFNPKQIPAKPGGRQVWGLKALPKDLVLLVGAGPLAFVDTMMHAYTGWSFVPFMVLPLKIALDQWTRLGDCIVDAFVVAKEVSHLAKESWGFFHSLAAIFSFSDAKFSARDATADGDQTIGENENWYPNLPNAPAAFWLKYPLLFIDGENDFTSS
jgi:hypothetical protein